MPRCEPTWKTTPSASIAQAVSTVARIVSTLLSKIDLVGRGEIAEVERVHEDGADPRLGAPLAEAREVLLGVLGKVPPARALREELHRVGADLDRPVERALDPA